MPKPATVLGGNHIASCSVLCRDRRGRWKSLFGIPTDHTKFLADDVSGVCTCYIMSTYVPMVDNEYPWCIQVYALDLDPRPSLFPGVPKTVEVAPDTNKNIMKAFQSYRAPTSVKSWFLYKGIRGRIPLGAINSN